MIACIVPAYKARSTVSSVVGALLPYVDFVVVVDDGCPDRSGEAVKAEFGSDPRVAVLQRERNGGVGAAVKTGIAECLARGASIVIKVDADGQMDPANIPAMIEMLKSDAHVGFVKGNRFVDESVLSTMPKVRFFGNAVLSLLVKGASGFWNILDPTNGFIGFNAAVLSTLPWKNFDDTYFFEISILGELGLRQVSIGEITVSTIYNNGGSSLSIRRVMLEFPPKIMKLFVRRLLLHYFLFDVNVGSLYIMFGSLLVVIGAALGVAEWFATLHTGHARSAGTVMLAVLPILIGFQLLSNALLFDVQFSPKVERQIGTRAKESVRFMNVRHGS